MFDILEDSTCESSAGSSLELDRIKDKVRSVWTQLIAATYKVEYKDQNEHGDEYVTLESYLEDNKLIFPGEDQPESEVDGLLTMLEDMLDPQEELESIQNETKAPTYGSISLSSNKEPSTVKKTTYDPKHSATITPSDNTISVKSTTYDKPETGKELKSETHESSVPDSIQSLLDLLEVERERLLKVVRQRNKEHGVIL